MAEAYTIIKTVKVGEAFQLIAELEDMIDNDPRDNRTAELTAVHIDNKFNEIELREFADGTREYALRGV